MTGEDIGNGLLELSELMAPMLDAADGLRREMERRGWSAAAAEDAALAWYKHMLNMSMRAPTT
jgi:hypothetical protein